MTGQVKRLARCTALLLLLSRCLMISCMANDLHHDVRCVREDTDSPFVAFGSSEGQCNCQPTACLSCELDYPSICWECGDGMLLYNGRCVPDCDDISGYAAEDGKCTAVHQPPMRFEAGAYAAYDYEVGYNQNLAQVLFRTDQMEGLVLYTGADYASHDFLALEIRNGHVVGSFELGGGMVRLNDRITFVSDGTWHSLEMYRNERNCTLKVDGTVVATAQTLDDGFNGLDVNGVVYLGGLSVQATATNIPNSITMEGFNGCLQDVMLDGLRLHQEIWADELDVSDCTMQLCDVDHLQSLQCQNDGVPVCPVLEESEQPTCICPDGTYGTTCGIVAGLSLSSLIQVTRPVVKTKDQKPTNVTLELKTKQMEGTLLLLQTISQSNNNGMIPLTLNVSISEGRVIMSMYPTSDLNAIVTVHTSISVNDDVWHSVSITQEQTHATLSVDGKNSGKLAVLLNKSKKYPTSQKSRILKIGKYSKLRGLAMQISAMKWDHIGILEVAYGTSQSTAAPPTSTNEEDIPKISSKLIEWFPMSEQVIVVVPAPSSNKVGVLSPAVMEAATKESMNRAIDLLDTTVTTFNKHASKDSGPWAAFFGDSVMEYHFKEPQHLKKTTIAFRMKSTDNIGTLFEVTGHIDRMVIDIIGGKLTVYCNLGDGATMTQAFGHPVGDGEWHDVIVVRYERALVLSIDNKIAAQAEVGHGYTTLDVVDGPRIGKCDPNHRDCLPGYFGHLSNVYFNGVWITDLAYGGSKQTAVSGLEWVDMRSSKASTSFQVEASFFGSSSIVFVPTANLDPHRTTLSLSFATNQKQGTLMLISSEENRFIMLSIQEGHVRLDFNLGDAPATAALHPLVADGLWHEIHLTRYGSDFSLLLDNGSVSRISASPLQDKLDDIRLVAVGDTDPSLATSTSGFHGRLANVVFDHFDVLERAAGGMLPEIHIEDVKFHTGDE